jgi:hypothetical protein
MIFSTLALGELIDAHARFSTAFALEIYIAWRVKHDLDSSNVLQVAGGTVLRSSRRHRDHTSAHPEWLEYQIDNYRREVYQS